MSGIGTEVIYWDTCIFYALFKGETGHGEGILEGIKQEFTEFSTGKIRLITSTATIAEVTAGSFENIEDFERFKNLKYDARFEFISPTVQIMELASDIRNHYYNNPIGENQEYNRLTLGDAIHIATAIHNEATAFVTLDGKNKPNKTIGLLKLQSPIADRYPLLLRKPIPPVVIKSSQIDMLEEKKEGTGEAASTEKAEINETTSLESNEVEDNVEHEPSETSSDHELTSSTEGEQIEQEPGEDENSAEGEVQAGSKTS